MTENEFLTQQRTHIERMKEMNARANQPNTPFPKQNTAKKPFETEKSTNTPTENKQPKTQKTNPPSFLEQLNIDGDIALIIGLLLLLMSDCNDKMLLFALIYILT